MIDKQLKLLEDLQSGLLVIMLFLESLRESKK